MPMTRTVLLVCLASALSIALLAIPRGSAAHASEDMDDDLQAEIEQLVNGFQGDVGIYVRHLETGESAALNADSLFPTASMIKVPILLKTFDAIDRGELDYDQKLTYRDSLHYPGDDLLGSFRDGEPLPLSKAVLLMQTTSDNTASLWLQHLSGTGAAINEWLADHGFESTRVNSRTDGRTDDWERYGWGQTTPREMAELVTLIRNGEAVSAAASEEMYRILTRTYWDEEALSQIPPTVQAASKQGFVSHSRSEVVLVNAPSGDYVFCIITKNQEDQRRAYDNEGFVLIRDLSRLLWTHFEPDSDWEPAEGLEPYRAR